MVPGWQSARYFTFNDERQQQMAAAEIKIRALLVRDRDTLAAMIQKVVDKIGDASLLNFMTVDPSEPVADQKPVDGKPVDAASGKSVYTTVGMKIIRILLESLQDDIRLWFSDLVGKTPEEFKDLPFNAETKIIGQVVESEEAADFFTDALRLYKQMQGYADKSSKVTSA